MLTVTFATYNNLSTSMYVQQLLKLPGGVAWGKKEEGSIWRERRKEAEQALKQDESEDHKDGAVNQARAGAFFPP
ncbi:hypothetical protein CesoFtcFv8_000374 [Champsocephalus esox]|uniref:Uncharacterized protein n=1 Tax=Champsocephalus esox TaxID=159716 RepID=A0AAN8DJR7_9TELE|nr:hypothetical protein CesoFtcFv8_000374 [Champsocephalus esox]